MKWTRYSAQLTIGNAIITEILSRNLDLVICALADGQSFREDIDDTESAGAYAALAAEIEEFQVAE